MSQWHDLGAELNNDVTYSFELTLNDKVLPLSTYTLTLYLKASQSASDDTATQFTVNNTGLIVQNASLGYVDWALPHTSTTTAGTYWWHLDAVDAAENRTTLLLGNLVVQAV